jgi:septal ring factor EnvC (AmiA/AmiB activator)
MKQLLGIILLFTHTFGAAPKAWGLPTLTQRAQALLQESEQQRRALQATKSALKESSLQLQTQKDQTTSSLQQGIKQWITEWIPMQSTPRLHSEGFSSTNIASYQALRKVLAFQANELAVASQKLSQNQTQLLQTESKLDTLNAQAKPKLLIAPLPHAKIVTSFGNNSAKGIELAPTHRPHFKKEVKIRATGSGTVTFAGPFKNYGQVVIIDHGNHLTSVLGNLKSTKIKTDQKIRVRDVLGQLATGKPLYWEVRHFNDPIDPLSVMHP